MPKIRRKIEAQAPGIAVWLVLSVALISLTDGPNVVLKISQTTPSENGLSKYLKNFTGTVVKIRFKTFSNRGE